MMPKRWKITEIHDHWGICREEDSQGDYYLVADVQPILDALAAVENKNGDLDAELRLSEHYTDMLKAENARLKAELAQMQDVDGKAQTEWQEMRVERDSLAASNKALEIVRKCAHEVMVLSCGDFVRHAEAKERLRESLLFFCDPPVEIESLGEKPNPHPRAKES